MTVAIPVFNEQDLILEAVGSILNQTVGDLELIVIDDASTDATPSLLASVRDDRLTVLRNPRNLGAPASLNRAFDHASGEFLARLDADDLAAPDRLEQQCAHLSARPRLGLLGSAVRVVESDDVTVHRQPLGHGDITWKFFFENPFFSSSVMVRRAAIDQVGGYDEAFITAEDADLWSRVAASWEVANLAKPLATIRKLDRGISGTRSQEQDRRMAEVSRRNIERLLGPVTVEDARRLRDLFPLPGPDVLATRAEDLARFLELAEAHHRLRGRSGLRDAGVRSVGFHVGWAGIAASGARYGVRLRALLVAGRLRRLLTVRGGSK